MTMIESNAYSAAMKLKAYCDTMDDGCTGCIFNSEDGKECTVGCPHEFKLKE